MMKNLEMRIKKGIDVAKKGIVTAALIGMTGIGGQSCGILEYQTHSRRDYQPQGMGYTYMSEQNALQIIKGSIEAAGYEPDYAPNRDLEDRAWTYVLTPEKVSWVSCSPETDFRTGQSSIRYPSDRIEFDDIHDIYTGCVWGKCTLRMRSKTRTQGFGERTSMEFPGKIGNLQQQRMLIQAFYRLAE